jgi:hypothetical protein
MTLSINMLAASAAAGQTTVCRSGNSYTSDAYGIYKTVLGQDIVDLLGANAIPLGQSNSRTNNTATTNPATTNDSTQDYGVGSHWLNTVTGVEYVCTDATANAAVWYPINGSYLGLSEVTGRFYASPGGSTQAAVLTVAGTLYAYPVFIPNKVTLDKIYASVTTGQTGGKVRVALFADSAGYPGAIIAGTDSGDLDGTGTAVVQSAALAKSLPAGWYWVGIIAAATSTMPSVIGATAVYPNLLNALVGSDTAAHALATSGQATTGIAKTGQTYPVTNMATSFPTFPAGAALTINATTPIVALGV